MGGFFSGVSTPLIKHWFNSEVQCPELNSGQSWRRRNAPKKGDTRHQETLRQEIGMNFLRAWETKSKMWHDKKQNKRRYTSQSSQLLTGQAQWFLFKIHFIFLFRIDVEYNSHSIFLSFDGLRSRKWYFYLPCIKSANLSRFESSSILFPI